MSRGRGGKGRWGRAQSAGQTQHRKPEIFEEKRRYGLEQWYQRLGSGAKIRQTGMGVMDPSRALRTREWQLATTNC